VTSHPEKRQTNEDSASPPQENHDDPEVTSGLVARSSKQTAVSQVITQGVRFLTSIVLARLLTPEDFGIVAVALIISAVLDRVKDMGTGMALIQRKHVDQLLLNSVFSFNVLLGALSTTPHPRPRSRCSRDSPSLRLSDRSTRACSADGCTSGSWPSPRRRLRW
jgi:hypothetical protein